MSASFIRWSLALPPALSPPNTPLPNYKFKTWRAIRNWAQMRMGAACSGSILAAGSR